MSDLEAQQRRLASNQALFRVVNAQVVKLNEQFEDSAAGSVFVCECANTECAEQVEVSLAEYQRVRRNDRWFFVAPNDEHVFGEVEIVVDRNERYYVVEKVEAAAHVAEETAAS
ncbi:MAG TPA: hypothetical protein VLJ39_05455 [Tepidisphaeraceae bacterium]|nr:hypothetical protein [Tepidisphaeraceae bacterium]